VEVGSFLYTRPQEADLALSRPHSLVGPRRTEPVADREARLVLVEMRLDRRSQGALQVYAVSGPAGEEQVTFQA
jgi:hypothetical protein